MWAGSPFGGKTKKKREVGGGGEGGKKPGPSLLYTGGTYSKILTWKCMAPATSVYLSSVDWQLGVLC